MANDKELLEEARSRFRLAYDAEATMRQRWREDWEFGVLGQQWDDEALEARKVSGRPALTVNKLAQHIRQVVNDIRQNRPAIKVLPVDDVADPETAEILTGVCRHIYHSSDGEIATDCAAEHAVVSGWGYLRVLTEVVDEAPNRKLQDIVLRRIGNCLSVYLDPDSIDPTGSDARWGFITSRVSKKEAKRKWKVKEKDLVAWSEGGEEWECWHDSESVIVAEYYYLEDAKWYWCKMLADRVIERTDWPSRFLPIVRVIGNESLLDGERDYWGMVRPARDAQKLYNLWTTAEAETVSLMPKSPYVMPAGADEGFEGEWARANTDNLPVIHYNSVDANGSPVAAPQRVQPPLPPAGIIQAKLGASDDIKAVTGQYDASLGQRSNETSGRAILARQREGDTSTFHYIDNVARSMRQIGRIIIDLLPAVYDVARIARIMGEDGTVDMVQSDPSLPTAMQQQQDATGGIRRAINPTVGRYDVMVSSGPSYTTKRQEGAEWMTQAMQGNPALMQIMGDLYFRALDVPYADDIAKRMKAMLPPQIAQLEQASAQGIPPQAAAQMAQMGQALQAMQAQMQQAGAAVQEAQAAAQSKQGDLALKAQELQIKAQELQIKAREVAVKEQQTAIQAQEAQLRAAEIQGNQAIEVAKLQADAQMREQEQMREAEESEAEGEAQAQMAAQLGGALEALAGQMAQLNQQVAAIGQTVAGQQTVAVKAVRDETGRIVGGVQRKADGSEVQVSIQ